MDVGLHSLVAIARFHQVPADADQLAHQFGTPGKAFSETDLLLAAKALTLKAKSMVFSSATLEKAVLPAIAKARDGSYFILARLSMGESGEENGSQLQGRSLFGSGDLCGARRWIFCDMIY